MLWVSFSNSPDENAFIAGFPLFGPAWENASDCYCFCYGDPCTYISVNHLSPEGWLDFLFLYFLFFSLPMGSRQYATVVTAGAAAVEQPQQPMLWPESGEFFARGLCVCVCANVCVCVCLCVCA